MRMVSQETKKVPENLQLAVKLTCGLTIVTSTVYVVLSIIALVYRYTCDTGLDIEPQNLFMRALVRVYIQADSCESYETPDDITKADSVFILVILILVTSVISCISAIVLIFFVKAEHELLHAAGYVYMATYVCTLTVDLTLGVLFGMDYSLLTQQMTSDVTSPALHYPIDLLRLGALLFMTIALKGFVLHMINITLMIVIIVYLQTYKEILNKSEHPIHNLGILDAYDQPKKEWEQRREMYNSTFAGGPQGNQGFIEDDYPMNRHPPRDNQRHDYQPSRAYEHSDSWLHSSNNQSNVGSTRPFTYLEEPARPAKAPSPSAEPSWRTPKSASPAVEPPWRGNWSNPPPVPAPDYSPQPRRLKSALKPGYM